MQLNCGFCALVENLALSDSGMGTLYAYFNSLQDEIFQKFNFDTEWAVKLISRITNDEDIPIEGDTIVKQVVIDSLCLVSSLSST